jgi:alginate O-acetyltransferase complex protein AlgI
MPNPIGISFYTFEAISYTVDVYRRKVRSVARFEPLLLFITFFPHVVAGPIVRARAFLPQIERWKRWSWSRCQLGLTYVSMGLFKKAALADRLAQIADPIFQAPQNFSSTAVAAGVLAYSIQVYCDFSGYTDIAIGLAHLLGFRLAPNFNMPYSAANVSDFWRRWHISLSSWLRDYVYIPLGGNSGGFWRMNRNLMITMLLGGLWHGASWNFVLWGALHGFYLCVHRVYKLRPWFRLPHALNVLLCFSCVTLAWVPFRSHSSAATAEIYRRLLGSYPGSSLPVAWSAFFVPMILVFLAHLVGARYQGLKSYRELPGWWLGLSMGMVAFLALIFAPAFGEPFIYFQF